MLLSILRMTVPLLSVSKNPETILNILFLTRGRESLPSIYPKFLSASLKCPVQKPAVQGLGLRFQKNLLRLKAVKFGLKVRSGQEVRLDSICHCLKIISFNSFS